MGHALLAAAAALAAAMLVALNYQPLVDYAGYAANRELYDAIAAARPAFEPRVVEPLVDPPDVEHEYHNTFGYTSAVHNPGVDSVTVTYDYPAVPTPHGYDLYGRSGPGLLCETCGDGAAGTHVRTYLPGQTFAYSCSSPEGSTSVRLGNYTEVRLSQYRGTSHDLGVPSFVFVHFEVRIPKILPCMFPHYLEHSVDVYDAGSFDSLYDLGTYADRARGDGRSPADLVGNPVMTGPVHIRALPVPPLENYMIPWKDGVMTPALNPDGTLTVSFRGWDEEARAPAPGATHVRTYAPGQTFLADCTGAGDVTSIEVYSYRGAEELDGEEHVVLATFRAYTRAPVPCPSPDFLSAYEDAFDAGRLDRHFDMGWYR